MELGILIPCILGAVLLLLFLPIKGAHRHIYQAPLKRFHEADSVLSRRLLIPGSHSYEAYYKVHPAFKGPDDRSRGAPGLLSSRSRYFHPATFAAAHANFHLIEFLASVTHQHNPSGRIPGIQAEPDPVSQADTRPDSVKTAKFITQWMKQTGAHSVGITPLKEVHLYSHKGRGPRSGQSIKMRHSTAIAITVEMDHRMMLSAPMGTTVMESSDQYLRSGILALKLAAFIREMGYEATAHIDGNYEVICPLVAVDAGLGTIGRMGLVMTPDLGPRVRISVVTTDLRLAPTPPRIERTTLHFCHHCRKCALNCPAAAIPDGPRTLQDGVKRWRINSEKCYHYWTLSGTDCGRCITACPFSHRNTRFHRFIRWGNKNNLLFRYLAIKLDDIFYGRKPAIRPLPEWANLMDKP